MKKSLFCIFSIFTLLFVGCDNTEKINDSSELVGTRWGTTQNIDTGMGIELEIEVDLSLMSESVFNCAISADITGSTMTGIPNLDQEFTGTWSYNEPNVTLETEGYKVRLELDDDELHLIEEDLDMLDDYDIDITLKKK